MLSSGSDCDDDDVDGCDKKTIPGTSCGDSYYLLLDFGLSGIHPPAVQCSYRRRRRNRNRIFNGK